MDNLWDHKQVNHGPPVHGLGMTRPSLPHPVHPALQAQLARLPCQLYAQPGKGSLDILPGSQSHVEPIYQTIGEIRKQKARMEEPLSKAKPCLIYGVITEKQVAKYVTPDPVRIRADAL